MPAYDYDIIACYSEDTEALTFSGWKPIASLQSGDSIMTFNPKQKKCRFQSIIEMHKGNYRGEMVNIETSHISLLVTPNHRVIVQNHIRSKNSLLYKRTSKMGYEDFRVYEAGKMPNGNCQMPISYPIADREDYPITDGLLKIIAWLNTEGWTATSRAKGIVKKHGVCISQSESNNTNCLEIKTTLENADIKHYDSRRLRKDREYAEHTYGIYAKDYRTKTEPHLDKVDLHLIPLWILQSCSLRQLKTYFDTLVKGDGHSSYGKKCFCSNLPENANRIQYLCHLLGFKAVNSRSYNKEYKKFKYTVYINDRDHTTNQKTNPNNEVVTFGRVKKQLYNGLVACPTTHDGFIVVRRNGKSSICGNSFPSIVRNLVDIRHCDWIQSSKYQSKAVYGYCKGTVTIYPEVQVSPIIHIDEQGNSCCPTGTFDTYLTKGEIDFIGKWKIGEFKIENGWWAMPKHKGNLPKPFEVPMDRLLAYKAKRGLISELAKRMSVGIYGKFLELHKDGLGKHFNSCWGAEASTQVRLQVAEFLYSHGIGPEANEGYKSLIHIGVDGVLVEKELKI